MIILLHNPLTVGVESKEYPGVKDLRDSSATQNVVCRISFFAKIQPVAIHLRRKTNLSVVCWHFRIFFSHLSLFCKKSTPVVSCLSLSLSLSLHKRDNRVPKMFKHSTPIPTDEDLNFVHPSPTKVLHPSISADKFYHLVMKEKLWRSWSGDSFGIKYLNDSQEEEGDHDHNVKPVEGHHLKRTLKARV